MNLNKVLVLILVGYFLLCGGLVWQSGLFESGCRSEAGCVLLQQTATSQSPETSGEVLIRAAPPRVSESETLRADDAAASIVTLGSVDPASGFKFSLKLSSKGAAIREAVSSEFNARDHKEQRPLAILSPVVLGAGREILSFANGRLVFVDRNIQLPLDRLHWKTLGLEQPDQDRQSTAFEALIETSAGEPALRLTKTYTVAKDSYQLDCTVLVENLLAGEQKVRFSLTGPVGIGREAVRMDGRKVISAFRTADGEIVSSRKSIRSGAFSRKTGLKDGVEAYETSRLAGDKVMIADAKDKLRIGSNLPSRLRPANLLWMATTNKYFGAILRPVPDEGKEYADWLADYLGWYYNPDGDRAADTGDETIGIKLDIASVVLAGTGRADSTRLYRFELYLGPKDRDIFYGNSRYRELGYANAIDFMPCFCCPASIIRPLAFGILAAMKWMYGFIPNYGIVIIILVFVIRIIIHPLTKSSQVSMSKFSKFNALPEVQELRKKYSKNMMEMNKRIAGLQKQHGLSPHHMIFGMLPMFVQMPIWISLYSAIYASIDLRGAAFLPVWITDLSAPDALFRFQTITLPLFGKLNSFNLLPLLMGVAFYLQQKMMPSQADPSNPQMAQQQKMMKIMFPLLFPLMLYKAPSGLNLYIMSSVFAGVIEQHYIKKHIREKEEAQSSGLVAVTRKTGGKAKKKKPKPFFRNF